MVMYRYNTSNGTSKGVFNIFQDKSGFIRLLMGNADTILTKKQISELGIDCYSIIDFSHDDFMTAYN